MRMVPQQKKILLVDNEPSWHTGFASAMAAEGCVVHTTERFEDEMPCLAEYVALVVDAFFANVRYPALMKRAREMYPTKPIIVVSVPHDAEDARDAFRSGASDYLHKTAEWDKIVPRVTRYLATQPQTECQNAE